MTYTWIIPVLIGGQAIGISRGGRSTKIHAIVDSKGRKLNFAVTGGQVHDSQVVGDVRYDAVS